MIESKKKDPFKLDKNCGQESSENEHSYQKTPGYFQWDVIPGACAPYVHQLHFKKESEAEIAILSGPFKC